MQDIDTKKFIFNIYNIIINDFDGVINEKQYAEKMKISVFLAKQYLILAEDYGFLARDDSLEGFKFYRNLLLGYW